MYWLRHGSSQWDPFAEFRALSREVNRAFNSGAAGATVFPALNVWSNSDGAQVTVELPGVDPEQVQINVEKNQLTIEGERPAQAIEEDVVRKRTERATGRFSRSVRLPFEVEHDQVRAGYKQGVLTVTLPRAEATKPKRIEIASA